MSTITPVLIAGEKVVSSMDHQIFAQLLGNYGICRRRGGWLLRSDIWPQIKQNRTQTQSQIEQSLYEQWQTPEK